VSGTTGSGRRKLNATEWQADELEAGLVRALAPVAAPPRFTDRVMAAVGTAPRAARRAGLRVAVGRVAASLPKLSPGLATAYVAVVLMMAFMSVADATAGAALAPGQDSWAEALVLPSATLRMWMLRAQAGLLRLLAWAWGV
jgi:hypothetical protein